MFRLPSIQPRRRGVVTLLSLLLAVTVVMVGGGFNTSPPANAASDPVVESTPSVTLVVAPEVPVLARDAAGYRFTVLLRNTGETVIGDGVITVSIDSVAADVASAQESEGLPLEGLEDDGRFEVYSQEVAQLAAGEELVLPLSVSVEEMSPLSTAPAGIYGVHAQWRETDQLSPPSTTIEEPSAGDTEDPIALEISSTTRFIWDAVDAAMRVPLTLVVPLVLPSTVEGVPSRDQLGTVTPRLLQLLSRAEQHNATIAVDPRIIAAVRSLGSSAPANSIELIDRLERTLSPVFTLQFADADPAAQAALGFEDLMQPTGFSYLTRLGTFEPPASQDDDTEEDDSSLEPAEAADAGQGAAEGEPTPQNLETNESAPDTEGPDGPGADGSTDDAEDESGDADSDADYMPTYAELLGLENSRAGAWPADGQVNEATLSLLAHSGLTSLVLNSDNVTQATASKVTIGDFEALISDSALNRAATSALGGATPTEQSAGLANLAAELALAAGQSSAGMILALDRAAVADSNSITSFFAAIDDMYWAQVMSERSQPEGTATLRAGTPAESRLELLQAAMHGSAQIDELSALLVQPEYLGEYQRVRLMQAFSAASAAPHLEFTAIYDTAKLRDDELLRGVELVTTERTQLVGASSQVPITLRNALPFEAEVAMHAEPISAAITLSESVFPAKITAGGNTSVLVPVQSRVSSGESGLLLEVRDTTSTDTFSSRVQFLTLRTTIETIIMVVLGSAAAFLIGMGIWRSVRRRRAARSLSSQE